MEGPSAVPRRLQHNAPGPFGAFCGLNAPDKMDAECYNTTELTRQSNKRPATTNGRKVQLPPFAPREFVKQPAQCVGESSARAHAVRRGQRELDSTALEAGGSAGLGRHTATTPRLLTHHRQIPCSKHAQFILYTQR